MKPFILVHSADRTLTKTIRASLPSTVTIRVSEPPATSSPRARPDHSTEPSVILVDGQQRMDTANWISPHAKAGSPVVAIISHPDEREAAFRAGASDCLMKPLVGEEIRARLAPYLKRQEAVSGRATGDTEGDSNKIGTRLTEQITQNERWITIGRLMAAVCHNITNRMQATQGALSLIAEETGLPADIQAYVSICEQETRRVSMQVERLRRIYHPDGDRLEIIDLAELLAEAKSLAADSAIRRGLAIDMRLPTDLAKIRGRIGQLQFVLIGLLLNLIDLIEPGKGDHIWIQVRRIGPTVQFELSTDAALSILPSPNVPEADPIPASLLESYLGLVSLRPVIRSQNGDAGLSWNDSGLNLWFSHPIA